MIRYSKKAVSDLDDIGEYISRELKNPIAARDTVDGIIAAVSGLNGFPESGAPVLLDYEATEYRYVLYRNYMAFYTVKGDDVLVLRVIYGRSDYIELLMEF